VTRLVLAAQDMVECRAAVDFLGEGTDIPCELRRALETAAPVAYARPWGKFERARSSWDSLAAEPLGPAGLA
jgi:hypothetical protein